MVLVGRMYSFYCQKCKIRIEAKFGIGMMFPTVYRNTVLKAKNGEIGEEIQKFFTENPNGAIDVSYVFGVCSECGQYEKILDLTMYVPIYDKKIYRILGLNNYLR